MEILHCRMTGFGEETESLYVTIQLFLVAH